MFSAEMPNVPLCNMWAARENKLMDPIVKLGWHWAEIHQFEHMKGERGATRSQPPPLPAIILVSEEPLGELDVICMCVFEEGCS